MTEFTEVADLAEVPPGERKRVEVNSELITLFNIDGECSPFTTAARTKKPLLSYEEP